MPEFDYEEMKKEAEQYIKFEKDKKNRIAYITFDRPEAQNATSLGMRQAPEHHRPRKRGRRRRIHLRQSHLRRRVSR